MIYLGNHFKNSANLSLPRPKIFDRGKAHTQYPTSSNSYHLWAGVQNIHNTPNNPTLQIRQIILTDMVIPYNIPKYWLAWQYICLFVRCLSVRPSVRHGVSLSLSSIHQHIHQMDPSSTYRTKNLYRLPYILIFVKYQMCPKIHGISNVFHTFQNILILIF